MIGSGDRLVGLQDEPNYLFNMWGPIGVYDEVGNRDEAGCLMAPLLSRLAGGAGRADLSEFLRHEVEDHFGLDAAACGTDRLADQLLAWYAAKAAADLVP